MTKRPPRIGFVFGPGSFGVVLEEDDPQVRGRIRRARYTVRNAPTPEVEVKHAAAHMQNPVEPVTWSFGDTKTRWIQRRHLLKGVYWTNGRATVWVRYNPLTTRYHYLIEGDKTHTRYGDLKQALRKAEEE